MVLPAPFSISLQKITTNRGNKLVFTLEIKIVKQEKNTPKAINIRMNAVGACTVLFVERFSKKFDFIWSAELLKKTSAKQVESVRKMRFLKPTKTLLQFYMQHI